MKSAMSNLKSIGISILIIIIGTVAYIKLNINDKNLIGDYYWNNEFGLYIKTIENESGHGRILDFDEIGWNDKFIVTKKKDSKKGTQEYSFIEISKDDFYLNPNEIVIGPLTQTEFKKLGIDIQNFKNLN
jgi:hypothetical protein